MKAARQIRLVGYALWVLAVGAIIVPLLHWYFRLPQKAEQWTSPDFRQKDEVIKILLGVIDGVVGVLIGLAILLAVCAWFILRKTPKTPIQNEK